MKKLHLKHLVIFLIFTLYCFSTYTQLETALITLKNKLEYLAVLLKQEINAPKKQHNQEREEQEREASEKEEQKRKASEKKKQERKEQERKASEKEEQKRKASEKKKQERKASEKEEQKRKASEKEEQKRKLWLTLVNDLRRYITTNVSWHAGDLYAHSVWTSLILEKWFEENKFWVADIEAQYKKILILAGYLHDIGKGGDNITRYDLKPEHSQVGFKYLTQVQPYKLPNSKIFDISLFLKELNLTKEEQKIITVLVGIHSDFGVTVMKKIDNYTDTDSENKKSRNNIYKNFTENIEKLCDKVNITLDRQILIMAIAINAADVKAAEEINYKSKFFLFPEPIKKVHAGSTPYKRHKFDEKGKIIYKELLNWYDQQSIKKNYNKPKLSPEISNYIQLYPKIYQTILNNYIKANNITFNSIEDTRAASYQIIFTAMFSDQISYVRYLNNLGGYTFVSQAISPPYFLGERNKTTLMPIERSETLRLETPKEKLLQSRKELVENYKIHLMPYQKDIPDIFIKFLEAIKKNPDMKNHIHNFKIKYRLNSPDNLKNLKTNEDVFPIIVIYPASSKKSAQKVLDFVYQIFKDTPGMDISPRFNKKITNLIYYSQGDGDYKKGTEYDQYYKLPKKIFYKSDFIEPGVHQDFSLKDPSA